MTRWHRQLRTLATAAGWTVGHFRLTRPHVAAPVFVSSTPSDWRVPLKVRAELRRRGAGVATGAERAGERFS